MKLPLNTMLRNRKGFSLVEVIASIVILSLILISIIVLFAQSAKTTVTTDSIVDATYLAQSEMEELYARAGKQNLVNNLPYWHPSTTQMWMLMGTH